MIILTYTTGECSIDNIILVIIITDTCIDSNLAMINIYHNYTYTIIHFA